MLLDAAHFRHKIWHASFPRFSGNFVKDTSLLYCGRSSYIYYGSSVVFVPAIRASKPRRMNFTTPYSSGLWMEKIYNLVPISASRPPCFAIHSTSTHFSSFLQSCILCSNKEYSQKLYFPSKIISSPSK